MDTDSPIYDFNNWKYDKQSISQGTWLTSPSPSVSSRFGMTDFFTDGKVGCELLNLGIIPICQFEKAHGGKVNISFGPLLDNITKKPIKLGTRYPARSFYARFGLNFNETQSDTWATDSRRLNCVICRRPEKNYLHISETLEVPENIDPLNPNYFDMLAEYDRIVAGQDRQGFYMYGSGGNSIISGSHAPIATAATGGSTAFFEHSQMFTKRNISISEAARDKRIVVAAISGNYFPDDRYD